VCEHRREEDKIEGVVVEWEAVPAALGGAIWAIDLVLDVGNEEPELG